MQNASDKKAQDREAKALRNRKASMGHQCGSVFRAFNDPRTTRGGLRTFNVYYFQNYLQDLASQKKRVDAALKQYPDDPDFLIMKLQIEAMELLAQKILAHINAVINTRFDQDIDPTNPAIMALLDLTYKTAKSYGSYQRDRVDFQALQSASNTLKNTHKDLVDPLSQFEKKQTEMSQLTQKKYEARSQENYAKAQECYRAIASPTTTNLYELREQLNKISRELEAQHTVDPKNSKLQLELIKIRSISPVLSSLGHASAVSNISSTQQSVMAAVRATAAAYSEDPMTVDKLQAAKASVDAAIQQNSEDMGKVTGLSALAIGLGITFTVCLGFLPLIALAKMHLPTKARVTEAYKQVNADLQQTQRQLQTEIDNLSPPQQTIK